MTQSDRQRQKKADAKRRRDRAHAAKQAERDKFNARLTDFRGKAPMMERFLKLRGYEQKFYDFLDSYVDAFERESENAVAQFQSLLGVHEVDDKQYYARNEASLAASLGYSGLTQIFIKTTDVGDEYLADDRKSNVNGVTVAFRDAAGSLKTLVMVRRAVPKVTATEIKYAFKLIALFHELGHVHDWEKGINLREGEVTVLDAEVYAHQYAMRRLMEGDYRTALDTYLSALEKLLKGDGYRKTIAESIVGSALFIECQEFVKSNWHDQLNTEDATPQDYVRAAGTVSELMRFDRD